MNKLIYILVLVFLFVGCAKKEQQFQDMKDLKNIPKVQLFQKEFKF